MSLVLCLIDFHSHFKLFLFTDEFIKISQLVSRQLQVFFLDFALSGAAFFEQLLHIQSDVAQEVQQDIELYHEVRNYITDGSSDLSD